MTFIRQHACYGVERVRVRRILAQRHQEDRILLSYSIVHPLLQRSFLFSNKIVITDDVVDFHGVDLTRRKGRDSKLIFCFLMGMDCPLKAVVDAFAEAWRVIDVSGVPLL